MIKQRLTELAVAGQLPHALGFSGGEAGRASDVAWAVAQVLVCEACDQAEKPCGVCGPCKRTLSRQSESVLLIEPEATGIKIDSAHAVLGFLSLRQIGRARMVIVQQAQRLNPQAANALLKVIEEPPPNSYFILIAPEFSQMLPTLRSRCQVIRFAHIRQASEDMDPEMKATVFEFLSQSLEGDRSGLQAMVELARDRQVAANAVLFAQELLRDWSAGTELDSVTSLHPDFTAKLQKWPSLPENSRVELWQRAYNMEKDLSSNVDRALIFENFFIRAKNLK
jgi:DNA polymerase-3 subunit delta'